MLVIPYKKLIALIVLFLNSYTSFGQASKNFQLINNTYKDWKFRGCDTLYYTDQIKPEVLDSTIQFIASKKKFSFDPLYVGNQDKPFTITTNEQMYLIQELKKLKVFKWPRGMFSNSKRVSINETKSIFNTINKSRYCPIIYTFSKPIFLRNNTICLYLKQEQYHINDAPLSFNFYRKMHNSWDEYAEGYFDMGSYEGEPEKTKEEVVKKNSTIESKTIDAGKILNDSSTLKQTKFGKDVLIALKSSKEDLLKQVFPTLNQRIKIAQTKQVNPPKISEDDMEDLNLTYQIALNNFLYQCSNTKEIAKNLNVDFSKITFNHIEKKETFYPASNLYRGGPATLINMDLYITQQERNFTIHLSQVYFVDDTWRITGGIDFKEVK